jgi:hypothetical protein
MNSIKKDLEKIIKNQNTIMSDVIDIKGRVCKLENRENSKLMDEKFGLEAIFKEKNLLQQKINCIDESIKLLNEKLDDMKMEKEIENKDSTKPCTKIVKPKQCRYDRKGFCNKRERCLFFHTQRVCEDYVVIGVCSQENCEQRHPQNCHSFLQSQCKWGKRCKYLHKEQIIEKIIKSQANEKESNKDAIKVVETEEEDPLSNCNECTNEDKCIGCIMQRVYNDSFEKDEDMAKETVEDI